MNRPTPRNPRQARAIAYARERREREIAPLRTDIAGLIEHVGWRRARPIVIDVIGHATGGPNGTWWHKVGKRNGARLLTRPGNVPIQGVLFDRTAIPRRGARAPPPSDNPPHEFR
jgi:hypothetical protein